MKAFILLLTLLALLSCSPSIPDIHLTPSATTAARGDTLSITATTQDITWSVSGGTTSTTISPEGTLIIAAGETADTITVTATSTINPKKQGSINITVHNPVVIGPAGGIVFYDKGEHTDGWRYLEAAPASYEFRAEWGLMRNLCPGTSRDLGTGKANTEIIVKLLEAKGKTNSAAQLCAALSINGLDDWFLPSYEELGKLYLYNRDADNVAGFNLSANYPQGFYWTSSAISDDDTNYASYLRFSDGRFIVNLSRINELLVRPIRAF